MLTAFFRWTAWHQWSLAAGLFQLRGSIWPVRLTACDLLAEDHQLRLLLVDRGLEQLARGQGFQLAIGVAQADPVGLQSQSGTLPLLRSNRADRHHGDFAERIHRHLDLGKIDAVTVRSSTNLCVAVDHDVTATRALTGHLFIE